MEYSINVVSDSDSEEEEPVNEDIRDSFIGDYELDDFNIYVFDRNDGTYYLNAYDINGKFDLFYIYTAVELLEGAYTLVPVFDAGNANNTHTTDVIGIVGATITIVCGADGYVLSVDGVDVSDVPPSDVGVIQNGTEEYPLLITEPGETKISAQLDIPLYVKVSAGITATLDCDAYFATAEGAFGPTVTPTVDTVYMIYSNGLAGCVGKVTATKDGISLSNTFSFTETEILNNGAERTVKVYKSGNYKFKSNELFVAKVLDSNGIEIPRNADYTYTLASGEYTLCFGGFSNFGIVANTSYSVSIVS